MCNPNTQGKSCERAHMKISNSKVYPGILANIYKCIGKDIRAYILVH